MKAVRFHGIKTVSCDQVVIPQICNTEILIKVKYAGICGSDKHIFSRGMFVEHIPEVMGHEFVGIVEKMGSKVTRFKVGDAVTANPMIWCNKCESCLQGHYNTCRYLTFIGESRAGCFAEYICMEEDKVIKLPEGLSLKRAVLCEPLAVAIHTVKKANIKKDNKVAIVGMGPIGILIMAVVQGICNITSITTIDISKDRSDFVQKNYVDVNVKKNFDDDFLYDVIIDAAGSNASFNEDLNHLKANGKLYVVSLAENLFNFDINIVVNKQLKILGCNGYDTADIVKSLEYLSDGKVEVDSLITNEFTLDDCKDAFALLMRKDKFSLKIIFKI